MNDPKTVGKLIYDTIMGNTDHPQFNYDSVQESELFCDSGTFTFKDRSGKRFLVEVKEI